MASSESVMGLVKQQMLNQHKFMKLDKLLDKWFTAMQSEGRPMVGCIIMGKGKLLKCK
jgi:hypothetical protein